MALCDACHEEEATWGAGLCLKCEAAASMPRRRLVAFADKLPEPEISTLAGVRSAKGVSGGVGMMPKECMGCRVSFTSEGSVYCELCARIAERIAKRNYVLGCLVYMDRSVRRIQIELDDRLGSAIVHDGKVFVEEEGADNVFFEQERFDIELVTDEVIRKAAEELQHERAFNLKQEAARLRLKADQLEKESRKTLKTALEVGS